MRIVKIEENPNGSHHNHFANHITTVPDGWAVIPDGMELPNTFPFVSIEVAKIDEVMTVTEMLPGTVPPPAEPEPTWQERTEAQIIYTAMMTDTLLEV